MISTFPLRRLDYRPMLRERASAVLRFDPGDFDPALNTDLLILQPTPFCNIDCDYCYLPDRRNPARMSHATVRLAAERLVEDGLLGDSLTVVWHAGEPLVLPPDYYEDAFAAMSGVLGGRCELIHSFQTNATLISDEWCAFFKRHDVRLGVSVDGPAFIHDRHRRRRNGTGTHSIVVRSLERLREHGIPFHAIAVVTADALHHADAIYEFFRELGIREVGFNFDEVEGVNTSSSLAGQDARHRAFLERVFEHMNASGGTYVVRELMGAFQTIAAECPSYKWRGTSFPANGPTMPFALVNVAWDGSFSTFSPELLGQRSIEFGNFILGNVAETGYLAAARGHVFEFLWAAVRSGVDACRERCAYFKYCGGGAPVNKLYETGSMASAETLYCRAMIQRPFDVMLERFERAAANHPRVAEVRIQEKSCRPSKFA
jgi:uncharacterized protein